MVSMPALVVVCLVVALGIQVTGTELYSSFHCEGDGPDTRTCELRNVCLGLASNPTEAIFYAEPSLTKQPPVGTLLRLGTYTSSDTLSLVVRKGPMPDQYATGIVNDPAMLFYGPSHLYFHWLLDDVFGMYWMVRHHNSRLLGAEGSPYLHYPGNGTAKRSMVLAHTQANTSPHFHMAQELFSDKPIIDLTKSPACFSRIIAGPAQHHMGGPGAKYLTSEDLPAFVQFVMKTLGVSHSPNPSLVTVVQRKKDRILLNGKDLVNSLTKKLGSQYQVKMVYLEDMSFKEQIETIANTTLFVCKHGSGMSNIVFLPPQASVLELFPYGFQRPTFQGICIETKRKYKAWYNQDKTKTKFHPEVLEKFRLPQEQRDLIVNAEKFDTRKMPWAGNMYWITQDTRVNLREVSQEAMALLGIKKKDELQENRFAVVYRSTPFIQFFLPSL